MIEYTLNDILTSVIVVKKEVEINYKDLSLIPIHYPLLSFGFDNLMEVVTSKQSLMSSAKHHPLEDLWNDKLKGYKETDIFVLQMKITKIIS
jgi:hypothetical protein